MKKEKNSSAAGHEPGKEKILVLIPAFNEQDQIPAVIRQVREEIPQAKVLVINDGSNDLTAQQARASGAKVLTHPFNMGYGVALQTGYKYALQNDFDYVLQMDGDGQHDPRFLRALLEEVNKGKTDVAIGSRFLGVGGYRAPLLRRVGMRIFGFIAGLLVGQRITDPTSGYQALGRRAVKFHARDSFPCDYPDADVLVMLHQVGLRIREVPVGMHANANGRSMHSGLKPLYYIYKILLCMALNLLRKEPPA